MSEQMMVPEQFSMEDLAKLMERCVKRAEYSEFWATVARLYREYGTEDAAVSNEPVTVDEYLNGPDDMTIDSVIAPDNEPRYEIRDNAALSWNTCHIYDTVTNTVVSHHVSHFHAQQYCDELNAQTDIS